MTIRVGGDVSRLLTDLRSGDAVRRDAALARLRVLGPRAVGPLSALVTSSEAGTVRTDALRALDGIDDPRVIRIALDALDASEPAIRIAAIAVLRGWVAREEGTQVLDALTARALDRAESSDVRLAALDALSELPRDIVAPVLDQAAPRQGRPADDEPLAMHEWVAAHADAPLSELHAQIDRLRDLERQEPLPERREGWRRARGAVHAALARRGSRVALYDLRESFDATTAPLPLDFLTAMVTIGDASCLEPLARAWGASPGETWWRDRLSDAAADIMRRARLSGRSAVVKRIRAKWPGFA